MKQICFALLLAAVGCLPPPPGSASDARKAIEAANAAWPRLTSTGHADSIAEFYTQNAVVMPPNMGATRGKEAIRAFFATVNAVKPTLTLRTDSELVIKQLKGEYRVRDQKLIPLYNKAVRLLDAFDHVELRHVRREYNAEADRLANEAMDRAG